MLDDENFAKMYVRDRNLLRPSGYFVLKLELKRLGVAEDIIEDALKDQDEEELAKRAIESKGRYRQADFSRKAGFLKRRGFGVEVIYKVLKKN